jgi:hypothetical protein
MHITVSRYLSIILMISIVCSCQKKELVLNLVETACKGFKIHSPDYQWITDPSCGTTGTNGSIQVTFSFDGDKECINQINIQPGFYKADNSMIPNVAFAATLQTTDPVVTLEDDTITFTFAFEFASPEDADALNHLYFKLSTQNELGNKSKNLELRINGACSTVNPNTYKVVKEITVTTEVVQITLKDDATEDGDIVSIYLNGTWVLENYVLTNAGETFTFAVNKGDNHLVLFAVNEGKVGPNTVSLSINGTDINISPDLLTGEAVNIKRF